MFHKLSTQLIDCNVKNTLSQTHHESVLEGHQVPLYVAEERHHSGDEHLHGGNGAAQVEPLDLLLDDMGPLRQPLLLHPRHKTRGDLLLSITPYTTHLSHNSCRNPSLR